MNVCRSSWCPTDVRDVLELHQCSSRQKLGVRNRPLVAVGHSMGGSAALLAELHQPGTFDHIVSFEPVVFPFETLPPVDVRQSNPLTVKARQRKTRFESVAQVCEEYAAHPFFQSWDKESLEAYIFGAFMRDVTSGLRDANPWESARNVPETELRVKSLLDRDEPVVLRCQPEWEAQVYAGWHELWNHLERIHLPVNVITGEDSVMFVPFTSRSSAEMFRTVANRLPAANFVALQDCDHFMVLQQVEAVSREIHEALKQYL